MEQTRARSLTALSAVVVAVGLSLASGCSSTTSERPVTPSTASTRASQSQSAPGADDPGFLVPTGFTFSKAGQSQLTTHAGLRAAAPGVFLDQTTWTLTPDGVIHATTSRLTLAPGHLLLPTTPGATAVLLSVAGAPFPGTGPYESRNSHGVTVIKVNAGWIATYAWVDPIGGMVWVLTEGFDNHGGQWPGFIDTLIAAQAART